MEDIKKSRQFILCTTVIRYSYVRKIDANKAGWGFNFQSQTKEEYQRWLQILKSQIPNCEKFASLELLAKVLSWAEMDGFERFDLGTVVNATIDEAEKKLKDKKDDDYLLYKNSTPDMAVLDAIKKEVGEEGSTILNMAVVLKELGKALFLEGFRWIQRKMKLVTRILEKEEEILQGQEYLSNLSSEVIQGKIESKAQVKMRYQDLNKKIKEAEVDIENYGKLQVANDGSIETKRIFYFVKVSPPNS